MEFSAVNCVGTNVQSYVQAHDVKEILISLEILWGSILDEYIYNHKMLLIISK